MNKEYKLLFRLSILLLLIGNFSGQAQERYRDQLFSNIQVTTYSYSDTLKLDYYNSPADTLSSKPLLILVHGGGFAIGKRDNPLEKGFSENMAKMGFAVASISYRLVRKDKSFGCDCPAKDKIETFSTASEDILKAAFFLISKSAELKFNPKKIILVGSSAGAEAVLNTAFMKHHHNFKDLPYENLNFAGIISFAGAVLDADYITHENMLPILLFHGEKDQLVPFNTAAHHYCHPNAPGYIILDGSGAIADRISALGGSFQLMNDPHGNHDWANSAYSRTRVISEFISKSILERQNIQSRIKINPED